MKVLTETTPDELAGRNSAAGAQRRHHSWASGECDRGSATAEVVAPPSAVRMNGAWMRGLRGLWPARARTENCDRCRRSMLEYQQLESERLCIRCVADNQTPALAGAMAVLRALWREAELDRQSQRGRPFEDTRRSDAIGEVAEILLWWFTPRSLRPPGTMAVGETTAMEVLAAYDRVWALRGSKRTLRQIYTGWATSHANALRRAQLEAVDRSYAKWVATEGQG